MNRVGTRAALGCPSCEGGEGGLLIQDSRPSVTPHTGLVLSPTYPSRASARDPWIVSRRQERNALDPRRPYAHVLEQEAGPDGAPVDVATVFLTNRKCPFRCVMCDLWRNTLEETVPAGAIVEQVRYALEQLPPPGSAPRHLKLYNAGSFFDPRAIPPGEHPEIARLAAPFQRVVVECHPAFVNGAAVTFRNLLSANSGSEAALEVAIGLETAHPEVLERLNKRMTLEQFRKAADFLRRENIALRVFILVRPPWLSEAQGLEWAKRSLDLAFECGASVCALIPTRAGNGAMDALAAAGEFTPPTLASLESALDYGLSLRAGRVFADLWDIEQFTACARCAEERIDRLKRINLHQQPEAPVECAVCRSSPS
ncbi:MAG: radical SAM protein [Actinomycetota bacterium]